MLQEDLLAAKDAAANGDLDGALTRLLEAWRQTRAPELARLVERVSNKIAEARPALAGDSPAERQGPWLELAAAGSDADLGRLLPLLAEVRAAPALERLDAVADRDADPRVASALVDVVLAPPFQSKSSFKFWRRLFEALVAHADPRTAPRLRPLLGRLREHLSGSQLATNEFQKGITKALERISAVLGGRVQSAEVAASDLLAELDSIVDRSMVAIDARDARVKLERRSMDDFLDAIAERPDDDGIRQVFADWLLERGDERGAFLSLQFEAASRELSHSESARMKALAAKHWRAWLGPLAKLALKDSVVWVRGFPVACRIKSASSAAAAVTVGRREWATIGVIEDGRHIPVEVYIHPVMRSLRAARGLNGEQGLRLLAGPPHLAHIDELTFYNFWHDHTSKAFSDNDRRLLGEAPGLPSLVRLGLRYGYNYNSQPAPGDYQWLWGTPVGQRLVGLELDFRPAELDLWLALLSGREQPSLGEVTLRTRDFHMRFRINERGWRDLTVCCDTTWALSHDPLATALARLQPGALDRIDYSAYPRNPDGVKQEVERLQVPEVLPAE